MNPFAINYKNLNDVIALARAMQRRSPHFHQVIVKYPNRANFNITMQVDRALADGATIVWDSATTK